LKIDGLRQKVVTMVHLHTTSFPDEGEALGRYLSYELKLESIDGEKRELTLHHFEDWPDLGAIPPRILAWISEEVRTIKSSAPVLVHCSAGVGRTGTVLAVVNSMEDVINQLVKEGKKMDEIEISVFEKILKLRQDRMESVERPLQYESVYRAIAEVVKVWTNRQGDVWKHI
jgi:protein tyrosine phosphatase